MLSRALRLHRRARLASLVASSASASASAAAGRRTARPHTAAARTTAAAGVVRRHLSSGPAASAASAALRAAAPTSVVANPYSIRLAWKQPSAQSKAGGSGAPTTTTVDVHNFWLRHNCDCRASPTNPHGCRHAATGERTVEPIDLDVRVTATAAAVEPAPSTAADPAAYRLRVRWSDGHASVYDSAWLAQFVSAGAYNRAPGAVTRAVDDADALIRQVESRTSANKKAPSAGAGAVGDESEGGLDVRSVSVPWQPFDKARWLALLRDTGVLVVNGAPNTPDDTLKIVRDRFSAQLIATHFGLIEDLRVNNTTNQNNDQLGYTNAPVKLHTDQPFIAHPPTMQMLHCIQPAECGGGSSVICDAAAVATHMRDHYPRDLFQALTTVPVHFHRKQKNFQSLAVEPIVRLGRDGVTVEQVRCSYFTMDPLHGPGAPYDQLATWYTAYNVFTALARSTQFSYCFAMRSGDFLVYDNWRMLHARTSFTGTQRFLRGIYLDKPEVFRFLSA